MKSHILFTWIKFLLIDSSLPDKKIWRKIIIWRWFDPHVRAEKIVFYFILIFCHFNFVCILVLLLTMRVVVFWKGLEVFKLLLSDVTDQYFLFFYDLVNAYFFTGYPKNNSCLMNMKITSKPSFLEILSHQLFDCYLKNSNLNERRSLAPVSPWSTNLRALARA